MRQVLPNRPDSAPQSFYLHPALEPVLSETYGVILYQEQVLRIAHELAGFSLSDADLLRRAMSHFDLDKQMQILKDKFIAGAEQQKGVAAAIAERIWELMAAFAGYGFPKAHAASYAAVAWQAAWCKTHYPEIFMAAVLANWGGYYSQRVYLTEARRMGLVIRPPHINHAGVEFTVRWLEGQAILFMGLGQIRDLTQRTIGRIVREQPFRSLDDFLARVDPRQQEAQSLIRVGALEGFGSQPHLLRRLENQGWRAGQLSLFPEEMLQSESLSKQDDWSLAEKVASQEAILGISLAAHPLELAEREIKASGAMTTVEAASKLGKLVRVAGMRQTWRRSRTQKGDPIYFMSLEDLEGMLDVIIPGEVYQKYRGELSGPGPYLVEGMLDLNPNTSEPTVRATRLARLKT
jgi:DNA polymerase III alpha subunit